ncbi:DUF3307 domain-containing protein [Bacteroidia bacterium]|nr:DUF3307 domain-containing protein [Bacteroidia bacterium]
MLGLFTALLLAHVLGDFVFQSSKWVAHKEANKQKSKYLYIHIAIHGVCTLGLLLLLQSSFLWITIPIVISHYLIDLGKLHIQNKSNAKILFFVDQALHIAILYLLVIICAELAIPLTDIINPNNMLLATLTLMATVVSSIIMRVLLQNWDKDIDKENNKSLQSAGKFIGILERLLVFTFVILNQWSAIGLLIAAKSAFRFGDLSEAKNRKLTEYMLIGTLLSFGLAMVFGILYIKLKEIN